MNPKEQRACLKVLCKCLNDLLEAEKKTQQICLTSDQNIKITSSFMKITFEIRHRLYHPAVQDLCDIVQKCIENTKMKINPFTLEKGGIVPR